MSISITNSNSNSITNSQTLTLECAWERYTNSRFIEVIENVEFSIGGISPRGKIEIKIDNNWCPLGGYWYVDQSRLINSNDMVHPYSKELIEFFGLEDSPKKDHWLKKIEEFDSLESDRLEKCGTPVPYENFKFTSRCDDLVPTYADQYSAYLQTFERKTAPKAWYNAMQNAL